ncbi:MAG: helix-turn-helix transcriptional regulator [Desulfobacteraceae bacterium]|nr:helix-turn-helix transcriptional regulator [Desulfobacteraceae bacterium]
MLNLTLKAVSEATGLSVGFLSQVERNLTSPSLSSLVSISKALKASVDYFLVTPSNTGLVNSRKNRKRFSVDGLPLTYARVSNDLPNGQIHSVITEVPPHWESETSSHEGEDFIYIISGTELIIVGGEEYVLEEGDTIHYDASIPHSWGNRSDKPAVSLFVGTQPLFPGTRGPGRKTNPQKKD